MKMKLLDVSEEVKLLYLMTNVGMYEGFANLKNVIKFSDSMREHTAEKDICVLLAKAFCYEQLIEHMVQSLYEQNTIWECIKNKNINYSEKFLDTHYKKVENLDKMVDFAKAKDMKKQCDKFRRTRNLFAHKLLENEIDQLAIEHNNLDEIYHDIYEMYTEQNVEFVNRVEKKLKNPIEFLSVGKDYSKDLLIIKESAQQIIGKAEVTEIDKDEIFNLHQIYCLLRDVQEHGCSNIGLRTKEGLWTESFYSYISIYELKF